MQEEPFSSEGVEARWAAYDVVALHVEVMESRLTAVLGELASMGNGA